MIIQIVKLRSELSEETILDKAKERMPKFKAIPGLLQKYYVRLSRPNQYSGIYVWDSIESLQSFRESELAASIPQAYKLTEPPEIEVADVLFQLRD